MTTKSSYQLAGNDLRGIVVQMNRYLANIADRLDKLEGLRGELESKGAVFDGGVSMSSSQVKDSNGTKLHSME